MNFRAMLAGTALVSGAVLLLVLHSSFAKSEPSMPPKREFRGVWIASVANIDWPSQKGLSPERQQQEIVQIFDNHKRLGINAVFVQVRAASDAFYAISNEPWSEWLTGTQGKAPSPFYDPLNFMIEHAHERNMEFHAWLNLNRGTHGTSRSITPDHITRARPEWFLHYSGYKVYNFGLPEVRKYIVDVVVNLVKNYDLDGIHFDDYFYPYPTPGHKINDLDTYKKYGYAFTRIEDWRRDNVNRLIRDISEAIQRGKPQVKFGVSPFAVWRNRDRDAEGSRTNGALSSYDDLYADSRLWAREGWVDYTLPQVYFSTSHKTVPYQPMVDWWVRNKGKHHLYIGIGSYRIGENTRDWAGAGQIMQQVRQNERTDGVGGSVYYSSKSLMPTSHRLNDSLRNYYKYPALPPVMEWKKPDPLPRPEITLLRRGGGQEGLLEWTIPTEYEEYVRSFVIYRFKRGERRTLDDPRNIVAVLRNKNEKRYVDQSIEANQQYEYALTAVDRLWNESTPSKLHKLF
jgi:uncharacterized lipoprotein YddW (UPF0748 family)